MIDSLRRVLQYAIEFLEILPGTAEIDPDIVNIANLIAAYDALAPDWLQAPDWAKWYAIDADGDGRFREREPEIMKEESRWYGIALEGHIDNVLPIGIDWRLCKWQRPEVMP